MSNILTYKIPDSLDSQTNITKISNHFSIKKESPIHHRQMFFDTFDWRLFNNGSVLIRERNEYCMSSLQVETVFEKAIVKASRQPRFWWDFPDGSMKEALKKQLDVRALIPLVEIEKSITPIRILNKDEKTVLKIRLENIVLIQESHKNKLIDCIKLLPVRGYDQEFDGFKNWLKKIGINEETKQVFLLALEAVGKEPGDYSSKLSFTLQPEMTARAATKVILRFLLEVIKKNEQGVITDIDIEFLHDFRVAMRRTRSALSQIKGVVPRDVRDQFKGDFALLQKSSNHLRDLDVYLLSKAKYQQMLPEHLRPGLEPLFNQLQKERKAEHKNLVKVISADSYTKLIESWDTFLDSLKDQPETKNSSKPVINLAQKFTRKAYKNVIELGSQIKDDSPAAELHQLRIECKKLRYLLEFFASLFPKQEISLLIKQLKKLQDNLGDFNDLSVQQKSLKKYLESISSENSDSQKTASAIGGLIASLYQQQQNVRNAFAQTFAEFSGQDNEKIYQKLFA